MKQILFVAALCSVIAVSQAGISDLAATSPEETDYILADMVQNNPGDDIGWQTTKYTDPAYLKRLGYNAQASTGETAVTLAVDFHSTGHVFFPEGSAEKSWMDRMGQTAQQFISRAKGSGLKVYFFVDLMVFPKVVIDHYKDDILNEHGKITFNAKTRWLTSILFNETVTAFPDTDGFIIRTGETYVYDNPYHVGNSPLGDGVSRDAPAQQQLWAQFISFLRDEVAAKLNKKVFFRTWDNFGDWNSPQDYYLNVTDNVTPHRNLYISVKHTAGDFLRYMDFNPQVGIGKHPQIIEVECQREYEGKQAYPNYVMNGIIDGFPEMEPNKKKGIKDIISKPQIRGLWTWSRGGGWWGPYLKDPSLELWVDMNVNVILRYFIERGATSELDIFMTYCQQEYGLSAGDCTIFRSAMVDSAEAMLNVHYCPEAYPAGPYSSCWTGVTRDDRIGGLAQLGGLFKYLKDNNLLETSLNIKKKGVDIWSKITSVLVGTIAPALKDRHPSASRAIVRTAEYGQLVANVFASGWRVMVLGTEGSSNDDMQYAIREYDRSWAEMKGYCLGALNPPSPSLYHDYYFNLPGDAPQKGIGDTVNGFRTK